MPDFVRQALQERALMAAYLSRPPYQQNDYLGWILRAKRPGTQQKRLAQMLDELAGGEQYMGMPHHAVRGTTRSAKDELIQGLVDARRKVLQTALSLSPEQRDEVFLGVWSAKDVLAHMAGWDDTNVQAVQEILAGQRPSFWQYQDHDWQSYNARLVAQYRREDWAELLAELDRSHRALIAYLQSVPVESYMRHRAIASLLRTEARDEEKHARQMEEFRSNGASAGGQG